MISEFFLIVASYAVNASSLTTAAAPATLEGTGSTGNNDNRSIDFSDARHEGTASDSSDDISNSFWKRAAKLSNDAIDMSSSEKNEMSKKKIYLQEAKSLCKLAQNLKQFEFFQPKKCNMILIDNIENWLSTITLPADEKKNKSLDPLVLKIREDFLRSFFNKINPEKSSKIIRDLIDVCLAILLDYPQSEKSKLLESLISLRFYVIENLNDLDDITPEERRILLEKVVKDEFAQLEGVWEMKRLFDADDGADAAGAVPRAGFFNRLGAGLFSQTKRYILGNGAAPPSAAHSAPVGVPAAVPAAAVPAAHSATVGVPAAVPAAAHSAAHSAPVGVSADPLLVNDPKDPKADSGGISADGNRVIKSHHYVAAGAVGLLGAGLGFNLRKWLKKSPDNEITRVEIIPNSDGSKYKGNADSKSSKSLFIIIGVTGLMLLIAGIATGVWFYLRKSS